VSVRPAVLADAPGIARAHVRAWLHNYAEIVPYDWLERLDVEERAARWAQTLRAGESLTWVHDHDGLLAGFASVRGDELVALYVDPAAQGAGVGTALLAEAVGCGARRLTVFEANAHARAFYERFGWVLDGPGEAAASGPPTVRYRCSSP
jgi:GNAT superfamily N-acetyltransferase